MTLSPRQQKVFDYLKGKNGGKVSTMEIQNDCDVCGVAKVVYELRALGLPIPPADYFGLSRINKQRIYLYWMAPV